MKFKTAGAPQSNGDNIIDRSTTGTNAGGITNEPAFPNNNTSAPQGQGGSYIWAGPEFPAPPSGDAVEQYFDPGEFNADGGPNPTGLPEQAYAKPTDASRPAALGPGMTSRG